MSNVKNIRVCLVTVFSLTFCFQKKFFFFLKLKNLFDNSKYTEKKKKKKKQNVLKTQFVKETKNMQKAVFSFYFSKIKENIHLI